MMGIMMYQSDGRAINTAVKTQKSELVALFKDS